MVPLAVTGVMLHSGELIAKLCFGEKPEYTVNRAGPGKNSYLFADCKMEMTWIQLSNESELVQIMNGLVLQDYNKPLPEPMLIKVLNAVWCHKAPMS